MAAAPNDPGPALKSEHRLQLRSDSEYQRSALIVSNGREFRWEFSDVTLAYDDGQVQSYKGLLAPLSPWLGQLLLAAGGHCDMVILPGIDCQKSQIQLFIQKLLSAREFGPQSENYVRQEDCGEDDKSSQVFFPVLEGSFKDDMETVVSTPSIFEGSKTNLESIYAIQSV